MRALQGAEKKIPHIIHYFWFGGGNKSENVEKCIASWKRFCPDFEIREWNESNYDVHKHPFMEKAFNDKKWAFVSDYARLDVLYTYGGIYLDTDVEVIKDLSPLCEQAGYMGFETDELIGDGQGFGFSAGHPILRDMMNEYTDLDEYIESPKLRTKVLKTHGLKLNGSFQNVEDVAVYPTDYFCPLDYRTGKTVITPNTYSIHHFDGSWKSGNTRKYVALMRLCGKIFGAKKGFEIYQKLMVLKGRLIK